MVRLGALAVGLFFCIAVLWGAVQPRETVVADPIKAVLQHPEEMKWTHNGIGNLVPQIQAGNFKLIAVDSLERSPLFPNVPTLKDFKLEHTRIKPWYGFMAPAGTPPAIIKKLHDEIVAIYQEPTMRERSLANAGLEPILDTPEQFARFLDVEWERTAKQMKIIGATPQ